MSSIRLRLVGITCLLGLVGVLATSCGRREPQPIPVGVQTFTGVLLPTDISLTRRGTHLLKIGQEILYYVESPTINLRSYEGRLVAVRGQMERNVDPMEYPVLVADHIQKVLDASLREWKAPHVGLSMQIPIEWSAVNDTRGVKLFLSKSGSLIVDIFPEKLANLPYDFRTAQLKTPDLSVDVSPILIGSTRAVRMLTPRTGDQRISFVHESHILSSMPDKQAESYYDVLTFVYTPERNSDGDLDTKFLSIIHSLTFSKAVSNTSASSAPSSDGAGMVEGTPCGGPAGILCGLGEYCEVTDLETNIGKCRKL